MLMKGVSLSWFMTRINPVRQLQLLKSTMLSLDFRASSELGPIKLLLHKIDLTGMWLCVLECVKRDLGDENTMPSWRLGVGTFLKVK